MKYFDGITNKAELKKAYVRLAKKLHPDNGGDQEAFKAMKNEYTNLCKVLPETAAETAKQENKKSSFADDEKIREMVDKLIKFAGLNIEIVGSWVWVDGNTYPVKENLKELGFQWSRSRQKWHWAANAGGYHRGTKYSFDDLRNTYGSDAMKSEGACRIA